MWATELDGVAANPISDPAGSVTVTEQILNISEFSFSNLQSGAAYEGHGDTWGIVCLWSTEARGTEFSIQEGSA